jgi:hypothetical protein
MNQNWKKRIKYSIAKRLFFIPDALMLSLQYRLKTGRKLNLKDPERFTEKLQYYKMHYRNPDMTRCVDKYDVRSFVKERLGTDKYLNTLFQVCHKADEINFDALPDKFVIKTTDGGDGANVMVCADKSKLDVNETIKTVNSWRNKRYDRVSREWAYKGAKDSRVIVEKYLEDDGNADGSIDDYKFLCYDGKFRFLWVDKDRFSGHKRGFWDENLNFLEGVYSDWPTFGKGGIPLPENIQEMIALSEKLAAGFPFARIDWYNIKGKITFGEITFYPWSGNVVYTPDSFDFELGKFFNVNWKK